jgi:putative transcriptional regulator
MKVLRFHGGSPRLCATIAACAALALVVLAAGSVMGEPEDESKPYFLVATSELSDPIFQRSVILMLPPAPPPNVIVAGLIINKPTTIPLHRLFPKAIALKDGAAYFGGPVGINEGSLLLRTPTPPLKATRLLGDVYLSTDRGSIIGAMGGARTARSLRFMLGRAQWTREQLRREIMEGAWYTTAADADTVFSDRPQEVWQALVKRAQLLRVKVAPSGSRDAAGLFWAPEQTPY